MNAQHDSEERPEESQKAAQESFGTWLRRQRVVREIELREIAETSKISMRYLSALEEDRFELLPAPVFAKGFLRQYAKYVGLDPEEVVNFFLAAQADNEAEVEPRLPKQRSGSASFWTYFGLFVLLAALLLGVVWVLSYLNEATRDANAVAGGSEAVEPAVAQRSDAGSPPPPRATQEEPSEITSPPVSENASAADDTTSEASSEPLAAAVDGDPPSFLSSPTVAVEEPTRPLRVTLDFTGECWTEVWIDGERRIAEIRVQGESLRLDADREIELKLGDVGAVEVEVNGRPYPVQAVPGSTVRRLRIDLETARNLSGASQP